MNILAIETATEACSVALWLARGDGGPRCVESSEQTPRSHTQRLLPMIERLLQDHGLTVSDLDLLACSQGPGAFTGLRIGIAAVQGLAFALDLPVVPVSTLAALAQTAHDRGDNTGRLPLLPVLDARMDEVYWGLYQVDSEGRVQALQSEQLSRPEQVAPAVPVMAVGSGCGYAASLRLPAGSILVPGRLPSAAAVARLAAAAVGAALPAARLEAMYLRNEVAWQRQ